MEPRKIIQFGNSSYVITLQQDWMKENNLDKGDKLNVTESGETLILSVANKEKTQKMAEISFDDIPLKLFNKELISYYLKNFKYIKIKSENAIEKLEQIRVLKDKLSSVEITEITEDYIMLKDLTSPEELDVKKLTIEIVNMGKILFTELKKSTEGKSKYFLITNLDKNINKLTFLAYKAINYNLDVWKNPAEVKDTHHLRMIISSLEAIGDIVKRIARYLKDDDETSKKFYRILDEIENYYDFVTGLIDPEIDLDENLKAYLDKKQSLLKSIDFAREDFNDNLNLYLVVSQLLKDILGKVDSLLLAVIDLKCK
ncbi:MAG: phosphate uptake regulator PhoU [Nanoarchaeales archaeon]|nr:phosphate uptake regulator PhoU [Nanoarchaeales archaeon]